MPDMVVSSIQLNVTEVPKAKNAKTSESAFDELIMSLLAAGTTQVNGAIPSIDSSLMKQYGTRLQAVAGEVAAASKATGVDARIINAFMIQESGAEHFENGQVKKELYGGVGIMQISPENAGGYDLSDRAQNILRGAQILKGYLDKYAGNPGLAAIAYNSGQGALASAFRAATGRNINSMSPEELRTFNALSLKDAVYRDALNRGYTPNVAVVKRDYAVKLLDKINHLGGLPIQTEPGVSLKAIVGQAFVGVNSTKWEKETNHQTLPVLNVPMIPGGNEPDSVHFDIKQDLAPIIDTAVKELNYSHSDKVKSFEVKLSPEHLGSIVLKVSLEDGQLNTHIVVSNGHVANLLNSQLGDLRHILTSEGLSLGQLDVGLQQNSQQGSADRWGTTSSGYQGSDEEDILYTDYGPQDNSGQALDVLA